MPMFRESLDAMQLMCEFQVMCSSTVIPRKLNSGTLSILMPFSCNDGGATFIFFFVVEKNINFVLDTLRESLLADSHLCIFSSSVLIVSLLMGLFFSGV
jgi:hypothetical protein